MSVYILLVVSSFGLGIAVYTFSKEDSRLRYWQSLTLYHALLIPGIWLPVVTTLLVGSMPIPLGLASFTFMALTAVGLFAYIIYHRHTKIQEEERKRAEYLRERMSDPEVLFSRLSSPR